MVIIGGGVIGLCVGYYAQRRGYRVTIVERGERGDDSCSVGNAGMIVPSHFTPLAAPGMVAMGLKWMGSPESPFYLKPRLDWDLLRWGLRFWRASTPERVRVAAPLIRDLSWASRECYEELAERVGLVFGLEKRGLLMLSKTEKGHEEERRMAVKAVALGISAEVLDGAGVALLEPNITMDVVGGVYFSQDCHLSPNRFLECLERAIDAGGGEWSYGADVLGWKKVGNKLGAVVTTKGEVEGDEFVLCGGAWSSELGKQLGLELPLQAGKGYALTLSEPREMPKICAILTEARVAVTPMGSGLRFGGTMEFSGLHGEIDPRRVRGIIRAAPKYYPHFREEDFEGIRPWSGLRPCSPDGLPYLGRVGNYGNVVVATGHAMMGLSLGPITGKLVADILSGVEPKIGLVLLDPDRFMGRRRRYPVNLIKGSLKKGSGS